MIKTKGGDCSIAIMGPTGSGKTSFINMASQSSLRVGSSLESCTMDIQLANPFTLDGYNITLIDTPGFDDTTRSDSDILQLIASFLSLSYEQGHALSGIIYVHRISDVKMGGMSRRNFSLFRKLCGDNAMKNVAIVTTRWDCVQPDVGKSRELELTNNEAFFKPVLDLGAKMIRHQPQTPDGTQAILRRLIRNQPVALQIQEELVDRQLHLSQTMAGAELGKEQLEQVERHRKVMAELEEEIRQTELTDIQTKAELEMERQILEDTIRRVETDRARMSSGYVAQNQVYKAKLAEMRRAPNEINEGVGRGGPGHGLYFKIALLVCCLLAVKYDREELESLFPILGSILR